MRVNPVLPRDYNSDGREIPTWLFCAGYHNPSTPPDYSPRDKRPWLRACLHVDCPIERCLEPVQIETVPIHWHEYPAFIRVRARDKEVDLGGDGHTPRLVTKRNEQGLPG